MAPHGDAVPPRSSPLIGSPEAHERFRKVRFQGKIVRVVDQTTTNSRTVKILISNGISAPTWYSLSPQWYLKSKGCSVRVGMFIKGMADRERGSGSASLHYVRSMSVNGELCKLRDSHMIGFWEGGSRGHDEE